MKLLVVVLYRMRDPNVLKREPPTRLSPNQVKRKSGTTMRDTRILPHVPSSFAYYLIKER